MNDNVKTYHAILYLKPRENKFLVIKNLKTKSKKELKHYNENFIMWRVLIKRVFSCSDNNLTHK